MTTIIWPVTLPQEMVTQGLGEDLPDNTIRTKTEYGPTRDRRRTTSGDRSVKGTLVVHQDDYPILEDFYFNITKDGTIRFQWVMPLSGADGMFKFEAPPSITSRSGEWLNVALKFKVRKL